MESARDEEIPVCGSCSASTREGGVCTGTSTGSPCSGGVSTGIGGFGSVFGSELETPASSQTTQNCLPLYSKSGAWQTGQVFASIFAPFRRYSAIISSISAINTRSV